MYSEDEIIYISALEHYSYCPRQCALIHMESIFDENIFTLKGRQAHELVDEAKATKSSGISIERSLPLWSDRLGLLGKSDVVEFHPDGSVIPVEYKHGAKRIRKHDDLQLCAQALCLEEMLKKPIMHGAIYSIKSKRRRVVNIDDDLRKVTEDTIRQLRGILCGWGPLPLPLNDRRCTHCSLYEACMPDTIVNASHSNMIHHLYQIPVTFPDIGI